MAEHAHRSPDASVRPCTSPEDLTPCDLDDIHRDDLHASPAVMTASIPQPPPRARRIPRAASLRSDRSPTLVRFGPRPPPPSLSL